MAVTEVGAVAACSVAMVLACMLEVSICFTCRATPQTTHTHSLFLNIAVFYLHLYIDIPSFFLKYFQYGSGGNRWMDKSFQLIVDEDGNGGSNIEHSWSEAPVPLDMFLRKAFRLVRVIVEEQKRKAREGELGAAARARIDQAVVEAYHDINKSRFPFFYEDTIASETKYRYSRGTPPTPTPIVFDLTAAPSLQRTITKASAAAIKALDDSDLVTRLIPQFSKETLKALGESPDVRYFNCFLYQHNPLLAL